jgi:alpha-ketoglutarate-dependent taurine dioxygenase
LDHPARDDRWLQARLAEVDANGDAHRRDDGDLLQGCIAFSRRFGELDTHDSLPRDRHPDHPELLLVTNIPKASGAPSDSRYTGQQWHSDLSFTSVPSLGSLLRGITIPPVGGDTMFTNMYLAWETLSRGLKKLLDGLHGIHTGSRKIVDLASDRAAEQRKLNPPIAQPPLV